MYDFCMELTGGQALARQLVIEGITDIFGIPGVQLDFAMDGLAEVRDQLTFRNTRHEQATTYMADGFARSSGRVGVSMVVPGPGVLNAMAALSTAWACSSPVLFLAGQIPSTAIGLGRGLLHEIPDQSGVIAGLTKWSALALSPAEVPGLVHEALAQLRSGRPRPVALEVPPDVLNAKDEISLVHEAAVPRPLEPDEAEVDRAVKLLSEARHPVICAGWGVQAAGATGELRRLAEVLGAPVVTSQHGRGSLDDRHAHVLTSLGAPEVLRQADAVLAVGTRFVEPDGSSIELPESTALVVLNADEELLAQDHRAKLRLLGDALLGLRAIADGLDPGHRCDWEVAEFEAIRRSCAKQIAEVEPQASFVRALREAIPEDGILVTELTQVGYLSLVAYPVYGERTFLTPGYQGTLGYGFPTALGAKVANPGRMVVSITGDGGFGWNMQELATARAHGIGLVTVVFNDNAFGNVRRTQVDGFGGRIIGSDLVNPDFVALGSAFGIRSIRAETPSELTAAISSERDENEPLLIEVPVGPMPTPWHLLHPAARRARIAKEAATRAAGTAQSEAQPQRSDV
jgi:acetolactate synthase-1/2/3 large subunit